MSYCRFQNTSKDLNDCLENINDNGMSEDELEARNSLIETCKQIVEDASEMSKEDLEEDVEE